MTIKLKKYQETCLEILRQFLELSRFEGASAAYEKIQNRRYSKFIAGYQIIFASFKIRRLAFLNLRTVHNYK